jgi:fucose permease
MTALLLAVIYAAFISLGLPDSLLGSAWPVMHTALNVPLSYAGIVTMLIAGGTIVSSLLSVKLIRRLGTGLVTAVSVAATALALFGFSFSHSYVAICLWSIPYGLGAGSVDAALNNFVALHYQSRHMNWLHCFWGVGASLGPYIMGQCLAHQLNWNDGYRVIGYIQTALVALLVFSLPLWKRKQEQPITQMKLTGSGGMRGALKLPGAAQTLTAFFCYCALESTTGLWASSYMVTSRGIDAQTAAMMASLFYLGITGGRFLSGWISVKLNDRYMVRIGIAFTALGIGLMLMPFGNTVLYTGLVVLGLGCAPIYPSLLHETPENFGQAQSQTLMGMQMASAYTGSTIMPMVFGLIAQAVSLALLPLYLLVFLTLMLVMSERATRIFASRASAVPRDPTQA